MASSEHGSARYQELPLTDATKQIRLLRFTPINDEDTISCQMSVHDLQHSEDRYIAISYPWGSPSKLKNILINGYRIQVRFNCWQALWQVRRYSTEYLYWIDSVCIDQTNNAERNAQVAIMGSIYSRADHVAACVGNMGKNDPAWYNRRHRIGKTQIAALRNELLGL